MLRRASQIRCALAALAWVVAVGAHAADPPPPKSGAGAKPPMPAVVDFKTRHDLKEPFNLGQGKVRIVAFLSPTCSHCIANAQGLQQVVLDALDTPDIAVHAVWLPVLDTDSRAAIANAATVLRDKRVRHYWDPQRLLNAQLLDVIQFDVQVRMYDIFLLYDRQTNWDKRLPVPGYWMHEYRGAPGPTWNAAGFAAQVARALESKPLDSPRAK